MQKKCHFPNTQIDLEKEKISAIPTKTKGGNLSNGKHFRSRNALLLTAILLGAIACAANRSVDEKGGTSRKGIVEALQAGYPSSGSPEKRLAWVKENPHFVDDDDYFQARRLLTETMAQSDVYKLHGRNNSMKTSLECGEIKNLQLQAFQEASFFASLTQQTTAEKIQEYKAYVRYVALEKLFKELCIDRSC